MDLILPLTKKNRNEECFTLFCEAFSTRVTWPNVRLPLVYELVTRWRLKFVDFRKARQLR